MIDIKKVNNYEIDVFLKVTTQSGKTAYEIIEEHIKVTKENSEGYTWWGNNQPYTPDRVEEFKSLGHNPKALIVIPESSGGSDNIEFIADICDSIKDKDKCSPEDEWSPQYYRHEKHKVWLKLKNIKQVNVNRDRIDISQYYIISNNEKLESKMKTQYACGYVYRYKIDNDELYNDMYQDMVTNSKETNIEYKPQNKPELKSTTKGNVWDRNPGIARQTIINANYLCELDERHLTFTSSKTHQNFVEAHHLIPMKKQGEFDNSLDVPGNIVALCPNCHRAIHLSDKDNKENTLRSLYDKRKEQLDKFGIKIDFEDLCSMYE